MSEIDDFTPMWDFYWENQECFKETAWSWSEQHGYTFSHWVEFINNLDFVLYRFLINEENEMSMIMLSKSTCSDHEWEASKLYAQKVYDKDMVKHRMKNTRFRPLSCKIVLSNNMEKFASVRKDPSVPKSKIYGIYHELECKTETDCGTTEKDLKNGLKYAKEMDLHVIVADAFSYSEVRLDALLELLKRSRMKFIQLILNLIKEKANKNKEQLEELLEIEPLEPKATPPPLEYIPQLQPNAPSFLA